MALANSKEEKSSKLREPLIAELYRQKIRELIEEEGEAEEVDRTEYKEMIDLVLREAKEVCGEDEKRVENPWMVGKEEELQRMKSKISGAVTQRNTVKERERVQQLNLEVELNEAIERLREARREMKPETRRCEREWWEEKIQLCAEAEGRGDSGKMYKVLKELG